MRMSKLTVQTSSPETRYPAPAKEAEYLQSHPLILQLKLATSEKKLNNLL